MGMDLFDVLTLQGQFALSLELQSKVLRMVEHKTYRRNSILLKPGQLNDKIWFVQKGLLRGYSLVNTIVNDEEKVIDVTWWFRTEGEFAVSIPSFYKQVKSTEYIEAYEETEVFFVSYDQLNSIYLEHMEFNFVGRVLLQDYLIEENNQNRGQKRMSADQRYEWLCETKPQLIHRVKEKYLASYMGITAETFSKVKKNRRRQMSRRAIGDVSSENNIGFL